MAANIMFCKMKNELNNNNDFSIQIEKERNNNNLFKVIKIENSKKSLLEKSNPIIEIKESNESNKEINKDITNNEEKIGKSIPWTKEDDNLLLMSAKQNNEKNWKKVASSFKGRTSIQCSSRYHRIRPGLTKGHFSREEDLKLISLYKIYGKKWNLIAKGMKNRTGKQVRDRFLNSLAPGVNKKKFTKEEDKKIIKYYKIFGKSWSTIAKFVSGRTGDMIKNRFYSNLSKYIKKDKNFKDEIIEEEEKDELNLKNINNESIIQLKNYTNENNCQNNLNKENSNFNNNINNNNIFFNNYFSNSSSFIQNIYFPNILSKENVINRNNYLGLNINSQNNKNNGIFKSNENEINKNLNFDYYYNLNTIINNSPNINNTININNTFNIINPIDNKTILFNQYMNQKSKYYNNIAIDQNMFNGFNFSNSNFSNNNDINLILG